MFIIIFTDECNNNNNKYVEIMENNHVIIVVCSIISIRIIRIAVTMFFHEHYYYEEEDIRMRVRRTQGINFIRKIDQFSLNAAYFIDEYKITTEMIITSLIKSQFSGFLTTSQSFEPSLQNIENLFLSVINLNKLY